MCILFIGWYFVVISVSVNHHKSKKKTKKQIQFRLSISPPRAVARTNVPIFFSPYLHYSFNRRGVYATGEEVQEVRRSFYLESLSIKYSVEYIGSSTRCSKKESLATFVYHMDVMASILNWKSHNIPIEFSSRESLVRCLMNSDRKNTPFIFRWRMRNEPKH